MSPAPNVGVGILKTTFRFAIRAGKIRLGQIARAGALAVVDGKERVHATVRTAIRVAHESRFTHRTIQREEWRDLV